MLCSVACWCSDFVNLVVAMELNTDINKTHENQYSRKISISRIIFLALENWTVWIGCNKQLLVLVSESRSTVDGSNYVAWGGGGLSPTEQERGVPAGLYVARGRVSEQTFLSLLWESWHLFFHPCSRWTPARVSVACSLGPTSSCTVHRGLTACVRADTCDVVPRASLCSSRSGAACWQKYWYRILPKIAENVSPIPILIPRTKSIGNSHANTPKVSPIVSVEILILRY